MTLRSLVTGGKRPALPTPNLLELLQEEIAALSLPGSDGKLPIEQELQVIPRTAAWAQFIQDDLARCRELLDKNYELYEAQWLEAIYDATSALCISDMLTASVVDEFELSYAGVFRFLSDLEFRLSKYGLVMSESLQNYYDDLV